MELYLYRDTPPEKYYEACITYHLIGYFEQMYGRRLYPFSISQIQEKKVGFDFGYELSRGNVFLAQFKRPYVLGKSEIGWKIEKEQAEILAKQPVRAYYVLPAFLEREEWYEGLDKTFFVPAGAVYTWTCSRNAAKSAWLHACDGLVAGSDPKAFDPFGKELKNALQREQEDTEEAFLNQMRGALTDQICGYWIGEVIGNGAWQLL